MGKMCIDAAQKSMSILAQMANDGTLSSLIAFDSTCILRLIMIFILAYAHTRTPQYSAHIEKLIELSRGMEQIGFTKMVTEETPMRLADLGIMGQAQQSNGDSNGDCNGDGNGPVHLDDEMIAQLWGNWDP